MLSQRNKIKRNYSNHLVLCSSFTLYLHLLFVRNHLKVPISEPARRGVSVDRKSQCPDAHLVCDHCLYTAINYTAMTETNYIKQASLQRVESSSRTCLTDRSLKSRKCCIICKGFADSQYDSRETSFFLLSSIE